MRGYFNRSLFFSVMRNHLSVIVLAAILPLVIMAPIATGILDRFDYPQHGSLAQDFSKWPVHHLYHSVLTGFSVVLGSWDLAQRLLLLANYAFLGVVMYIFLVHRQAKIPRSLLITITVALLFIYPIPLLFPYDHHFYHGYIAVNVYHNPTILLLKPIVLLHALWMINLLDEKYPYNNNAWFLGVGAILVILSALAKPSYLVVLLPCLVMVVVAYRVPMRPVMLSVFIPGMAMLAWQFLAAFGHGNGLLFAPFFVISTHSELWTIPLKALLSILFPLAMLVCIGRRLLADRLVVLAWLMFLVGSTYGLLLAETATSAFHGNWLWSGQIAAFLLFAVSARGFLKANFQQLSVIQLGLVWSAFLFQLLAGLVWYLIQYNNNPPAYW